MTSQSWNNPWKLTAIGMALVVATALATGLVVANLSGKGAEPKKSSEATAPSRTGGPQCRHFLRSGELGSRRLLRTPAVRHCRVQSGGSLAGPEP
jgi:hypothetical protein